MAAQRQMRRAIPELHPDPLPPSLAALWGSFLELNGTRVASGSGAGPVTFGRLYDLFPFDNRLVTLRLTGAQLERVFLDELKRDRPGALSLSGVRVQAFCEGGDARAADGDEGDCQDTAVPLSHHGLSR